VPAPNAIAIKICQCKAIRGIEFLRLARLVGLLLAVGTSRSTGKVASNRHVLPRFFAPAELAAAFAPKFTLEELREEARDSMRRAIVGWTVTGVMAACLVARAPQAAAIETTYGEDPVPDTRCYKGFLELGYGIDPIPAKTLSQRWREWRAGRGYGSTRPAPHYSTPPHSTARHGTTAGEPPARPSARRVQPAASGRR
jgi:hypothetical protein